MDHTFMRTFLTLFLSLFALVLVVCTSASDVIPVTKSDQKFLIEVVDAVGRNDAAWIADHMVYPVSIVYSNETHLVTTKKEFAIIVSERLTDSIRIKIKDDSKKPIFKNWQGIMIGNGLLWFSEYQPNRTSSWTYGIYAIGGFSFQPKSSN